MVERNKPVLWAFVYHISVWWYDLDVWSKHLIELTPRNSFSHDFGPWIARSGTVQISGITVPILQYHNAWSLLWHV